MKSLYQLHNRYLLETRNQRFGQWFVNYYIDETKESQGFCFFLFYADNSKSKKMISEWLINNQYIETLPPRLR